MKKRFVRCCVGWGVTDKGIHNVKVFYSCNGFGYRIDLFMCMNCGEIFVVDFGNPHFHDKSIQEITQGLKCPTCSCELAKCIQAYPAIFRTKNGDIGHFIPEQIPSLENEVVEFYEIDN